MDICEAHARFRTKGEMVPAVSRHGSQLRGASSPGSVVQVTSHTTLGRRHVFKNADVEEENGIVGSGPRPCEAQYGAGARKQEP